MNIGTGVALASAAALGLRHGFDYDHIAAISDITSIESRPSRSLWLGMLYAMGHAATVALLGVALIFGRMAMPMRLDQIAERIIGFTLVTFAIFVCASILSQPHNHARRSRIEFLISGCRWLIWRIGSAFGRAGEEPAPTAWSYKRKSVFLIGAVHGLGAETPTQLSLFLLAANLGGLSKGLLGLAMFAAGLVTMNAVMTASAAGMYRISAHHPKVSLWASGLTAVYSFCIGLVFLFGAAGALPPLTAN